MQQGKEANLWSEESLHETETDMTPERSPSNVDEFIFSCAPAQQQNNLQNPSTIMKVIPQIIYSILLYLLQHIGIRVLITSTKHLGRKI